MRNSIAQPSSADDGANRKSSRPPSIVHDAKWPSSSAHCSGKNMSPSARSMRIPSPVNPSIGPPMSHPGIVEVSSTAVSPADVASADDVEEPALVLVVLVVPVVSVVLVDAGADVLASPALVASSAGSPVAGPQPTTLRNARPRRMERSYAHAARRGHDLGEQSFDRVRLARRYHRRVVAKRCVSSVGGALGRLLLGPVVATRVECDAGRTA